LRLDKYQVTWRPNGAAAAAADDDDDGYGTYIRTCCVPYSDISSKVAI